MKKPAAIVYVLAHYAAAQRGQPLRSLKAPATGFLILYGDGPCAFPNGGNDVELNDYLIFNNYLI